MIRLLNTLLSWPWFNARNMKRIIHIHFLCERYPFSCLSNLHSLPISNHDIMMVLKVVEIIVKGSKSSKSCTRRKLYHNLPQTVLTEEVDTNNFVRASLLNQVTSSKEGILIEIQTMKSIYGWHSLIICSNNLQNIYRRI